MNSYFMIRWEKEIKLVLSTVTILLILIVTLMYVIPHSQTKSGKLDTEIIP